jgi:hypothetical protein
VRGVFISINLQIVEEGKHRRRHQGMGTRSVLLTDKSLPFSQEKQKINAEAAEAAEKSHSN